MQKKIIKVMIYIEQNVKEVETAAFSEILMK